MIGKSISHYSVTEKLGAGGMGEVYRVHVLKLEPSTVPAFFGKTRGSNPAGDAISSHAISLSFWIPGSRITDRHWGGLAALLMT